MKRTLLVTASLFAAACAARESQFPEASAESPAESVEVPEIPTQDDADAAAEGRIDAENADAEFRKLEEELEDDE